MKKTVSVVYTVFVVAALLCVIAFFGWKTYQSRAVRISDFVARTDDYTRRLSESLEDNRDLVNIGAYVAGSDPVLDEALAREGEVREFLTQGVTVWPTLIACPTMMATRNINGIKTTTTISNQGVNEGRRPLPLKR